MFYVLTLCVCCFTLCNAKATIKPISFKEINFAVNSPMVKLLVTKKIPSTTKQPLQLHFNDISFSVNGSKVNQNGTEEIKNTTSTENGNKKCNRTCGNKLRPDRNHRNNCCRRNKISRKN